MRDTQLMARFLEGSKRWFALAVIFSALAALFDLLSPKLVGFSVDLLMGSAALPAWLTNITGPADSLKAHIGLMALAVMLVAALGALCRYLYNVMNAKGAEHLTEHMRTLLYNHLLSLPLLWHDHHSAGDIIQRCTSDVETVKNFLSEQLTGVLRIVVMMALSLFFMQTISVKLTLLAAAFIPVIVIYSFLFHQKIGESFAHADSEEGHLSDICQENLTGVRVVRAFGREKYEKDRFETQNDVYTAAYLKLDVLVSAFWSMGDGISGLQVMLVVLLGALACVNGGISAGDYVAFVSYNELLVWPVRRLGRVISDMSKAGVSVSRLGEILAGAPEPEMPGTKLPDFSGDIVFSHVTCRYDDKLPDALHDVSLTIPGGSRIGILGGTGSGKSTLVALLDGLYPVSEGTISIGGTDISTMTPRRLRAHIGLVLQEPFLFSRTIRANMTMAPQARAEDMDDAVRAASLHHMIRRLSKGFDTFVGERGMSLSGGQKQRLAMAQTLIRHAPIMIFDDSLSAVDARTDQKIRHNLDSAAEGSTVILISSRVATLRDADLIIVLQDGTIAEQGTHKELFDRNGIYRAVCDIQNVGGEA